MDKNNKTNGITIQLARTILQLVFVGLLVAGVYMDLRMALMVFLPASLLFGNFFCGWACPMNIEVSAHDQVRNGQCINDMKCIQVCPSQGTLSYSRVKLPIGKNRKKQTVPE